MKKIVILGEVLSHKNLWKRSKWGGLYMSKPEEFNALLSQFVNQSKNMSGLPLKTALRLDLSVWGNDRKDLNNQIATICDLLERAEIILNDRQIKEIHAKKIIDIKNPRAEIEIN